MNELNLGSIKLPINSATKTFAVLAKRGAGKTYASAVLAEELYKNNIPFVVFDPIDVWWGLKLKSDGKSKGLPVVVFGLEHADIQLDKDMGRKIAQMIVKHNISCIISTFGMPKKQQRFLITEFAEELLNINNTPRHVFIEEAHELVPQRVFGELGKTFNAVSNLVVMGRNRGLGVTLINQRASTINKDVLTQLDTLIAMRLVAPQDRKALKEWVEYHSAEGDFEKFIESLGSLPTGEGWIWSPEFLGIFEKIKIRARETFHPDREKIGDRFEMPELDSTDIELFINEFKQSLSRQNAFGSKSLKQSQGGAVGTSPKTNLPTGVSESAELFTNFNREISKIKNEYESKLMQKDLEIRKRDDLINQIRRLLGVNEQNQVVQNIKSSSLQMWLEKLGNNSMPSNILNFLASKSGIKFTKSQIALSTGYSSKGGSFANALSLLRKNLLIKQEGELIFINPDL